MTVYWGVCAVNKCIHAQEHDAARVTANHTKSDLTARTDSDIIRQNEIKFNIYIEYVEKTPKSVVVFRSFL